MSASHGLLAIVVIGLDIRVVLKIESWSCFVTTPGICYRARKNPEYDFFFLKFAHGRMLYNAFEDSTLTVEMTPLDLSFNFLFLLDIRGLLGLGFTSHYCILFSVVPRLRWLHVAVVPPARANGIKAPFKQRGARARLPPSPA